MSGNTKDVKKPNFYTYKQPSRKGKKVILKTSREKREENSYLEENVDKKCDNLLALATADTPKQDESSEIVHNLKPIGFKAETDRLKAEEVKRIAVAAGKERKKQRKKAQRKKKQPKTTK